MIEPIDQRRGLVGNIARAVDDGHFFIDMRMAIELDHPSLLIIIYMTS
jgi:hypothetical protein